MASFVLLLFGIILVQFCHCNIPGDRHVHSFEFGTFSQEHELNLQSNHEEIHTRKRREADETCQKQETNFLSDLRLHKVHLEQQYSFENDSNHALSLTWAGNGILIVVTTGEVESFFRTLLNHSVVYRSSDDGRTFENITSRIHNDFVKKENGLQRNPHDPEKVYIIAHPESDGKGNTLYLTEDAGLAFTQIRLPFTLDDGFIFHPVTPSTILAHNRKTTKDLYISTDDGINWEKIGEDVHDFKWAPKDSTEENKMTTIYVTRTDKKLDKITAWSLNDLLGSGGTKVYSLEKSTDNGRTWTTLLEECFSFGLEGKFVFGSIAAKEKNKRFMQVSIDGGHTWNEAQLPTIVQDQFYSILDMSEQLVFLHVDDPGDTGHGTLYTSGADGIIYSESLLKHLYPNYGEVTDFYKVKSLRGVYFASQMSGDDSIHTRITFNRGASWEIIRRPEGVPCKNESKECNLQLHNSYSKSRSLSANEPLSTKSAVGIILAHGHVADSLQTTTPDVFVTRDGGYKWTKALDGPHHYQIADSGGLLIAVPMTTDRLASVVKFSTDEGRCWHEVNFTTTESGEQEPIVMTGLLTEPGSTSMTVGIWGFGSKDKKWKAYVLDFEKLVKNKCTASDYKVWTAHETHRNEENAADVHGCLLGLRQKFHRLERDSWCQNGATFEIPTEITNCTCTREDYECAYAYYRPDFSDDCRIQSNFKGPEIDICMSSSGYEEKLVTEGYRRIPGDVCGGGFEPTGNKIDLKIKCVEGNKPHESDEDGGDFVVPHDKEHKFWSDSESNVNEGGRDLAVPHDKEHTSDSNSASGDSTSQMSGKKKVLIVSAVVLTFIGILTVLGIYIIYRYYIAKKRVIPYRYSLLSRGAEQDGDVENRFISQAGLWADDDEELESGDQNGKVKSFHDDSDVEMLE